ncbi:MAG: RnfABCDGE type electron transport complex subunit D [Candidatus Gottesmanbacteria bacterium]
MIKIIDDFLNQITMYRLVLYVLITLIIIAILFSFLGILPFNGLSLLLSTLFLVVVCYLTNRVFSSFFAAPTNIESNYITALILALIITPIKNINDIPFLFWAGVLAIASKYILAINKKHIFNPAALAVSITALTINQSASWWIGSSSMMIFVLIAGLLIVRKIERSPMVAAFLITAVASIALYTVMQLSNPSDLILRILLDTPLLFFAFIMLTEPLTTPPKSKLRLSYGILVGLLFNPRLHLGLFYITPEIALLVGNLFSYFVSPKQRLVLAIKEKINYSLDIYDFVFPKTSKINYLPGQYMEWTLAHQGTDSRGNRRYFTLASSPTEDNLRIGVRFDNPSSSYKRALKNFSSNDKIVASQLAGDFTLPKDPNKKLVFIAGGIGITPFRSMIKYLLDINKERQITLFYSNKYINEIVYRDIFTAAGKLLHIKTIYTLTDQDKIPSSWTGRIGRINEQMIIKEVPDFKERVYYISGTHNMVTYFKDILKKMGIDKNQIRSDFFPGYT